MKFYTYILVSSEGFHYTGYTPDLQKRIFEHNLGITHSTKHGHNWQIIHSEEFNSRSDAIKREKWLKSGAGRQWVKNNVKEWSLPKAE